MNSLQVRLGRCFLFSDQTPLTFCWRTSPEHTDGFNETRASKHQSQTPNDAKNKISQTRITSHRNCEKEHASVCSLTPVFDGVCCSMQWCTSESGLLMFTNILMQNTVWYSSWCQCAEFCHVTQYCMFSSMLCSVQYSILYVLWSMQYLWNLFNLYCKQTQMWSNFKRVFLAVCSCWFSQNEHGLISAQVDENQGRETDKQTRRGKTVVTTPSVSWRTHTQNLFQLDCCVVSRGLFCSICQVGRC